MCMQMFVYMCIIYLLYTHDSYFCLHYTYPHTGSNRCSSKYKNNNNTSTISCCISGYNASIGWDPMTGWGSISLSNLITLFEPVFSGPSTASTPAPSSSPAVSTTSTPTGAPTGTPIYMPPSPEPSIDFTFSIPD